MHNQDNDFDINTFKKVCNQLSKKFAQQIIDCNDYNKKCFLLGHYNLAQTFSKITKTDTKYSLTLHTNLNDCIKEFENMVNQNLTIDRFGELLNFLYQKNTKRNKNGAKYGKKHKN